uniref:Uncharacterized protein n=1 Tax=viral metagenome TaxID=1070528 RepID=A0A6C0HAC4_9ZZZZ
MGDFQREDVQRINNPDLEDEYGEPSGLAWRTRNAPDTRYPDNLVISPKSNYTPQAVDKYADENLNNKIPKKSMFSGWFGMGGKKFRKSKKSRKSRKSRKTRRRRRRM